MTVLIDSNILIGFLKGEKAIIRKIENYIQENIPIFLSTISIYEVYVGIIANLYMKEGRPNLVPRLLSNYRQFIQSCSIIEFNLDAAEKAADIYAQAQGKGINIRQNDCFIAGIALSKGITEVFTTDKTDFERIYQITGLKYQIK
jgi:predicted nucleic acid-binding protein